MPPLSLSSPAFIPAARFSTLAPRNASATDILRLPTPRTPPPNLARSSFTSSPPAPLSPMSRTATVYPTCPLSPCAALDPTSAKAPSVLVDPSRRQYLASFIPDGPVFQSAGLTLSDDPASATRLDGTSLDHWIELGAVLEHALGSQSNDIRVYQYYLPVYFWILRELDIHQRTVNAKGENPRPLILGFCCPQGGGKTTMTTFIEKLLAHTGRTAQIASIDDFYVTNKEQRQIAAKYPQNRLLQYRGMPGTHDVQLLLDCLDALRQGHEVSIPVYDKTAYEGRGDRTPKDQWKQVGGGGIDVFLLEGWCLGFESVPLDSLVDDDLTVVNDALSDFVRMYTRLDGMLVIQIADMEWVYDWRLQAERTTRAAGRPGLTDDQVTDFVSRFMPAYQQYSKPLYERPFPLFPEHELHIEIDQKRRPVRRSL